MSERHDLHVRLNSFARQCNAPSPPADDSDTSSSWRCIPSGSRCSRQMRLSALGTAPLQRLAAHPAAVPQVGPSDPVFRLVRDCFAQGADDMVDARLCGQRGQQQGGRRTTPHPPVTRPLQSQTVDFSRIASRLARNPVQLREKFSFSTWRR